MNKNKKKTSLGIKKFFFEIKTYPNNEHNQKNEKKLKSSRMVNWIGRHKYLFSLFLLWSSIRFNTFKTPLKEIFNPSINAKQSWKLWLGSFFRIITILLLLSSIAPLITNKLMEYWRPIAFVSIGLIAFQYFIKWFTCDLTSEYFFCKKALKLLCFPFKIGNIFFLGIWLIPLILLLIYPPGTNISGNILSSFSYSLDTIVWLILLLFSLSLLNEFQYYAVSKSMLVMNYVFKKNSKTIFTLIISLLIMVVIFSIIVMNVEAICWTKEYEQQNGELSKLLEDGVQGWFNSFYMCFITFTTIGFGDITPVTQEAKIVIMFSAIFGVAFYSLFTSIIVNGFIQYLDNVKEQEIERKDKIFREAIKELNSQLAENKISKSIYELKIRKIKESLNSNLEKNKKKIKLSSIDKDNLILKDN